MTAKDEQEKVVYCATCGAALRSRPGGTVPPQASPAAAGGQGASPVALDSTEGGPELAPALRCSAPGCSRWLCTRCAWTDPAGEGGVLCPEHARAHIWSSLERALHADYVVSTPRLSELQIDLFRLDWLDAPADVEDATASSEKLFREMMDAVISPEFIPHIRVDFIEANNRLKLVLTVVAEDLKPADFARLTSQVEGLLADFLA